MRFRNLTMMVPLMVLTACSPWPSVPLPSMPTIAMPQMADMVEAVAGRSDRNAFELTVPAVLDEAQSRSVRAALDANFPEPWQVSLLGLDTGRRADGVLVTCGIYNAKPSDGTATRSGVFRAETDPLSRQTVLREAANSGSARLVAYSNCQSHDLL